MPNHSRSTAAKERVVRVFVSSTFSDMHAERDELTKRVFLKLHKLCEQRGVTWTEVDLRWGITEEQVNRGVSLSIILAEIERCRPYFIGLLGERYGWVPDHIDEDLAAQQPWLVNHRDRSVTELEILHGALNDRKLDNRAFFYFRDPAYVERVPRERRNDFVEEDPRAHGKLEALKVRIRRSGLPVRENYRDAEALGEKILDDLTTAINQDFPPDQVPGQLDREAAEHEAFARSRTAVYVGRQEYFDRLDEHIAADGPPLVILGESGSGKSALMANWVFRYREAHPQDLVIMHFVGSSPESSDWAAMLRRIMGELKRRFSIQQEIPDTRDALRSAFANWLHMAAARGRLVLILDALNQLEDRAGAADLVWLPPVIPTNVRLILSTLPGRPLDDLKKRGWPALQVQLLQPDERRRLIVGYLKQYAKVLAPDQTTRVADANGAENPLYLRALLDELRLFGRHDRLNQRIDHYLAAANVADLYERILERYESDYDRECPGLVRDVMCLLWAARRGMSERRLLEAVGMGKKTHGIPRALWSPLYLAAEHALVDRSGLLTFAHAHIREAIRDRYLSTQESRRAAHLHLAEYYQSHQVVQVRPISLPGGSLRLAVPDGPLRLAGPESLCLELPDGSLRLAPGQDLRRINELPWQLSRAGAWQRLGELLSDPWFVSRAWAVNPLEVMEYWAEIEDNSPLRLPDVYRPVIDAPARYWERLQPDLLRVASLLANTGHAGEAVRLLTQLVSCRHRKADLPMLAASLHGLASALEEKGDLHFAMEVYRKHERVCRELGDEKGLAASFSGQAGLESRQGDAEASLALHKREQDICHKIGDAFGLGISLRDQAVVIANQGDPQEAMLLLRKAERIFRDLGAKDALSAVLTKQGEILSWEGDLDTAASLHQEAERVLRELGGKRELLAHLRVQATLAKAQGKLSAAMALVKEQQQLCRQLFREQELRRLLAEESEILAKQGDFEKMTRPMSELEDILRASQRQAELGKWLIYEAEVMFEYLGDRAGASVKCKEAISIWALLDRPYEMARARSLLWNISVGGTRHVRRVAGPLVAIILLISGIALGLWQRWLWFLAGPAVIVSLGLLCLFIFGVFRPQKTMASIERMLRSRKPKRQEKTTRG